jgi:hypothetical protein
VLHLIVTKYSLKEEFDIMTKYLPLELYSEDGMVLKTNKDFTTCVLAINSTKAYFSQLFYISLASGSSILLRPMNWINSEDALEGKEGKVNVIINKIEWSKDGSYIFLLINSRYFSLLNESGTPLKLFNATQNLYTHFALMPTIKEFSNYKVLIECYKVHFNNL